MRVLASALLALAAAAAIAQLGQPPISWVALLPTGSAGHAATPRAVLEAPVTVMKAIWWSMGSGQKGTQVQRAPAVGAGLGAPVARTPGTPDYHEPLVTYHLSAADLQLHDASPAQWPATHVVQLPLSSLAPLTSATYMPSEVAALSSQGYKTYMVRTVEFFQNQAAIHSMLAAWDAAGWVDPYTGVVTQPGALAMCGDTLARRRGYGRAAVAAQAAAAHRPAANITAWAAAAGVAQLRSRCPQSLLLTREGIAAAAVADVLDVTLLPAAAGGGGDAVELLLRVVDNPHIVAEHDPGHPVQELEGRGNHYHFVLPEDLAINATHLLQELGGPSRSNAALEPKGIYGLVLKGSSCEQKFVGSTVVQDASYCGEICSAANWTVDVSPAGNADCSFSVQDENRACASFEPPKRCIMTTTCTITNLGDVFITRFLDGKFFNRQWYCGVTPRLPPPPSPPPPPPPSPPPPQPPPPSPPPPPDTDPIKCPYGYSSRALPHGPYLDDCSGCCYRARTRQLTCATCTCSAAYTSYNNNVCPGPWRLRLPRSCKVVTYVSRYNKLSCAAPKKGRQGSG